MTSVIVDVADRLDVVTIDSFNGTADEVCEQMANYGFSNHIIDKVDDAISDLWGELPHATTKILTVAEYEFTIKKV